MEDIGGVMEEAHICPRREHNSYAPTRPNVLHCFGVDFLSNKEVMEIFAAWQPQQVEWLDDSSCNLVFEAEDSVQKAKQELALPGQSSPDEVWLKTKPISIGKQKDAKKGKARRGGLKELCLQLRVATEADRKDPGHSGHTDSVYYAHVKEQQALEKQATELRRMKKRQRQMTPRRKEPAPQSAENATGQGSSASSKPCSSGELQAAQSSPGDSESLSQAKATSEGAPSFLSARLESYNLLDPLLFMKASSVNTASSAQTATGAGEKPTQTDSIALNKDDDLKAALKRAEAEYAAVLHAAAPAHSTAWSTAECAASRGPGQSQRGKKRRPVEQEPRPVNEAAPPNRKAELLPPVENFLKKHGVRCRRYTLQRSFRSIRYAQDAAKATARKEGKQVPSKASEKIKAAEIPPWDQYLQANSSFISQGNFMQTVAWQVEGRRVLSVVPHSKMTDVEKVAKAVQKNVSCVKQCKLADISKETGFPAFVCPPFGYPPDAEGRPPLLLVDSSVTEMKRPLLFDVGSMGVSLTVSEFLRSTRACCVENLAQPMANSRKIPVAACADGASRGAPSPEPAPEPAPIINDVADAIMT
ncbi:hypothetical protein AK812_SmicGene26765 [Symbiodinium microadriaticum]|uniref:Uncharacterized protein n=2 Tax=Symbiodinium TaxID=2949 RepID=A0A1Q9D8K1_SYMMI|nr:hypothetical protein AK812_SmicGene26765 [Symbiodinium microadriaticum]